MKLKYILLILIILILVSNITAFGVPNANITVSIEDRHQESYYGNFVGFKLPGYNTPFEEYVFAYDTDWKVKKIYCKRNPIFQVNIDKKQKNHPKYGGEYTPVNVTINRKKIEYYINSNASIHFKEYEEKKETYLYISDIFQMRIRHKGE